MPNSRIHSALAEALAARGYDTLTSVQSAVIEEEAEGRDLISGYLFGIGAMLAKHVRCGHWSVRHVLAALAYRWAFGKPVVDFGFKPARSLRISGFSRGFLAGTRAPIDRRTSQFIAAANPPWPDR